MHVPLSPHYPLLSCREYTSIVLLRWQDYQWFIFFSAVFCISSTQIIYYFYKEKQIPLHNLSDIHSHISQKKQRNLFTHQFSINQIAFPPLPTWHFNQDTLVLKNRPSFPLSPHITTVLKAAILFSVLAATRATPPHLLVSPHHLRLSQVTLRRQAKQSWQEKTEDGFTKRPQKGPGKVGRRAWGDTPRGQCVPLVHTHRSSLWLRRPTLCSHTAVT